MEDHMIEEDYKDILLIVLPYESPKLQELYNIKRDPNTDPNLELTFSSRFEVKEPINSILNLEDEADYLLQEKLRELIRGTSYFINDDKVYKVNKSVFNYIKIDEVPVKKIKREDSYFCEISLTIKFYE